MAPASAAARARRFMGVALLLGGRNDRNGSERGPRRPRFPFRQGPSPILNCSRLRGNCPSTCASAASTRVNGAVCSGRRLDVRGPIASNLPGPPVFTDAATNFAWGTPRC